MLYVVVAKMNFGGNAKNIHSVLRKQVERQENKKAIKESLRLIMYPIKLDNEAIELANAMLSNTFHELIEMYQGKRAKDLECLEGFLESIQETDYNPTKITLYSQELNRNVIFDVNETIENFPSVRDVISREFNAYVPSNARTLPLIHKPDITFQTENLLIDVTTKQLSLYDEQ